MCRDLRLATVSHCAYDLQDLLDRNPQIIIHDCEIKMLRGFELSVDEGHTPLNHILIIRSATSQPVLKNRQARWKQKNQVRIFLSITHLLCALHFDFEHDVPAFRKGLIDRVPTRPVGVSAIVGVLKKCISIHELPKTLGIDEVVVHSVLFTLARLPSRMRNGKLKTLVLGQNLSA